MQLTIGAQLATVLAVVLAITACERREEGAEVDTGMQAARELGSAEYTVVVKSSWTAANHPYQYPAPEAHFSGLIGATHTPAFSLFTEGSRPTPGLERLSEQGQHSPLDQEIRAAITAGSAGVLFVSEPLRNLRDSLVAVVRVDQAHPLVSLVAMIAPSPDWFTGVRNVDLVENGAWAASRTLNLEAYDSGGDDGTTYKAVDRDTSPKKPTTKATTRHFVVNGVAVPVGTVTFTRN
jgi:hypothetical protein